MAEKEGQINTLSSTLQETEKEIGELKGQVTELKRTQEDTVKKVRSLFMLIS